MDWFDNNRASINQPEWLQKWAEFEDLRTLFFEVRYAFNIHTLGLVPKYEYVTVDRSSVDFELSVDGCQFLIELVSTLQSEAMSNSTEHISEISKIVSTNPAEELRKVQGKIVRKVAKLNEKTGQYQPHKFPAPQTGGNCFNVLVADTRGFNGGDHLEQHERVQLVLGSEEFLQRGGDGLDNYWLAGLFDSTKEGEEAHLFRERIHILALVSEKTFGAGEVIRQTRFYENPFLSDGAEALDKFPLRPHELDPYGKI
jgi:hypothetical protein